MAATDYMKLLNWLLHSSFAPICQRHSTALLNRHKKEELMKIVWIKVFAKAKLCMRVLKWWRWWACPHRRLFGLKLFVSLQAVLLNLSLSFFLGLLQTPVFTCNDIVNINWIVSGWPNDAVAVTSSRGSLHPTNRMKKATGWLEWQVGN